MFDILNRLSEKGSKFEFKFDVDDPLSGPIAVAITEQNLLLKFSPTSQFLMFIEVVKTKELVSDKEFKLKYKGNAINSIVLKDIYYNSFGPTVPGEFSEDKAFYFLSYPGISFKFNVGKSGSTSEDLFIGADNYCESISVYDEAVGSDESKIEDLNGQFHIKNCEIDVGKGGQSKIVLKLKNQVDSIDELTLHIGVTSQQLIMSVLGPPDSVFQKKDFRLSIHDNMNSSNASNSLFHNYFRLGMDLMYDISSRDGATLKKVVLHNNSPNSLLFQKYNKCKWEMNVSTGSNASSKNGSTASVFRKLTSQDKYADGDVIPGLLNEPVMINQNLVFESLDDSIEDVGKSSAEDGANDPSLNVQNEWGECLIYVYRGVILQVLNRNKVVNSLTLY